MNAAKLDLLYFTQGATENNVSHSAVPWSFVQQDILVSMLLIIQHGDEV